MAEVQVQHLPPVGMLEIILTLPRLSGYAGPAWPRYCELYVSVCGKPLLTSKLLPFEMHEEDVEEYISWRDLRSYVKTQAMKDMKQWKMSLRIPVQPGWAGESVDILVERFDLDMRYSRRVVVTRGGPHTSRFTAVIARARVPLLDALVVGDLDDDEDDDGKKRRRNDEVDERNARLLEGTVEFDKTVSLMHWELPAKRDAGENPRAVVRGTVDVRMSLKRLAR
ncbi:unnamed protein product [Urochloa decumbens]|uniref:Uncharacterized protein n=1 Tax=Urochloa decumbens TaxID=240449 RepID=A0ABC8YA17_9POAL